jgi:hypothetical protein
MIFKNHISTPSLLMALDSQVSALNKTCLLSVPAHCTVWCSSYEFFDKIEPCTCHVLDAQLNSIRHIYNRRFICFDRFHVVFASKFAISQNIFAKFGDVKFIGK